VREITLDAHVADAFGIGRDALPLPGTEGRTYRVGNLVLRQSAADPVSLWKITTLAAIREHGFRVERPVPARDGRWIVDGWSAWTYLQGRSATPADAAAVAAATQALHRALAPVPYAQHLTAMAGPADQMAWGDVAPPHMPEQIAGAVHALILLRAPITGLHNQVIHGDLNYHNILIAPGEAPGFIDFSPYYRPPEFAAAIAAYWLGPYQGETSVLQHFARVAALEQMLVRVAIRQLLRLVQMQALEWTDEFVRAAAVVCHLFR
jgi:uncharacterized protein (TIGR02569 family)